MSTATWRGRTAPPPAASGRQPGLDGLRGVAALVVVLTHLLMVVPAISRLYVPDGEPASPDPYSVTWWLYRTPLRVIWSGEEAVLVFFVLSGLVLTLPVARGASAPEWRTWYPRRLARLYLPVWASLGLALALVALVPRDVTAESSWIAAHTPVTARALQYDVTLLLGNSHLNSPLWSLRWEIWFSLLLPLAVLAVTRVRVGRWWPTAVVVLALCSALGRTDVAGRLLPLAAVTQGLLTYLPVFAIGVVLAQVLDRLIGAAARVEAGRHPTLVWGLLGSASAVAMVSPTYVDPAAVPAAVPVLLHVVSLLAVTALVVLAVGSPGVRRLLSRRPAQWLGSRSFSLYLVHEPFVVAAALLLGGPSVAVWGAAAVPLLVLAFGAAELFHRFVEAPSHRFSRSLGRARAPGHRTPVPAGPSRPIVSGAGTGTPD
ncbi:acyltransferase family protein [Modestobacter sp. VKM Ac-2985]|uniref:acyltransferase family protein n=1 Tax=Modestobacter sp. VKM Ac-2985 TaxID=3004139 RepID=UPI0022AB96EB|nr:acyltransferase [Modestobacter sp. VKM Ac-2985]MCZ2836443.1 acyltransferase [Modestobacter sp. VKM Ac-2985]